MGIEQRAQPNSNLNMESNGQTIINFEDIDKKEKVVEESKPIFTKEELDDLYKDDPEHPEEWWQK